MSDVLNFIDSSTVNANNSIQKGRILCFFSLFPCWYMRNFRCSYQHLELGAECEQQRQIAGVGY